jgi:predicted thioesterase
MTRLRKYTAGVGFRTNTPGFDAGDEVAVFVTDVESGTPVARVGDSKLRIGNAAPDLRGKRVVLRVTAFDDGTHVGDAEYLRTVGDGAF